METGWPEIVVPSVKENTLAVATPAAVLNQKARMIPNLRIPSFSITNAIKQIKTFSNELPHLSF
jgi:hypothetical protein